MVHCQVKFGLKGLVFETGYKALEDMGCAIVWMSAGNSYFKEEVVERLLVFANQHFSKVLVMAPDEPAEHTFKALGYNGTELKKKARLNANLLQNRARRVIDKLKQNQVRADFKVVEWIKEIIPDKRYQESYEKMLQLYASNESFRKDALETTKGVLKTKIEEEMDLDKAAEEAVHYLLKELAFVGVSPVIFNVPRTTYIYHNEWPIYEKWVNGVYDQVQKKNAGFLLVKEVE